MKKIKIVNIFLLAIIFILFFSNNVFAYNLLGGKYSRGVSNTWYYVDSTASSYTTRINAAANNWVNTGHGWNPIYMTPVSSTYCTHMDFYGRTSNFFPNNRTLANTRFYTNSSQDITATVADTSQTVNWFYAEININTGLLATNTNDTQGTLAHEMGHAFGLAHDNNNTLCIMCQTASGRAVYLVSSDDNDAINYLY